MPALSRAELRAAVVRDLTRQALALQDPSALWPIMAERLIAYFGCQRLTIFQRRKDRLVSRFAQGLSQPVALAVGEGVAGHAAETGEPYLTNAPYEDKRFDPAVDKTSGFTSRNLLAFPLSYRGQTVAVLELVNKPGGFNQDDLDDVRAIGSEISVLFVKFKFEEEEAELTRRMVQVEKMAALGRLASSMAHEVNNPLTAVLGFLQILERTPGLPKGALENLLKIDAEVRRIQVIVKDLLGFARAAPAAKDPVDLAKVAASSLDFAASELRYRRVAVERDLPDGLPPILGDANQLRQVFLNLFVNAMHAMDGRPGSKLRVSARAENGRVVAEVADNGSGMPPEVQDRVFEPFFTTKGENKGTGLGLYVSIGILESHGGSLTFDTSPERGTTFRLTLPAARPIR